MRFLEDVRQPQDTQDCCADVRPRFRGGGALGLELLLSAYCFSPFFSMSRAQNKIGREPEGQMLPTPRKFCRHILSERATQAASNKRRLHPVSGGITL